MAAVRRQSLEAAIELQSRWRDRSNTRPSSEQLAVFARALPSLSRYAESLGVITSDPSIAHTVKMLLDPQRARDVVAEGTAIWQRLADSQR